MPIINARHLVDLLYLHAPPHPGDNGKFSYLRFAAKFLEVFDPDSVVGLKVKRNFWETGEFYVTYGTFVDMKYRYNYHTGNMER